MGNNLGQVNYDFWIFQNFAPLFDLLFDHNLIIIFILHENIFLILTLSLVFEKSAESVVNYVVCHTDR